MVFFQFFKTSAIIQLEFIVRLLGLPVKCSWWSLLLCKVWWESSSV